MYRWFLLQIVQFYPFHFLHSPDIRYVEKRFFCLLLYVSLNINIKIKTLLVIKTWLASMELRKLELEM